LNEADDKLSLLLLNQGTLKTLGSSIFKSLSNNCFTESVFCCDLVEKGGKFLAVSGGEDDKIYLWDSSSGEVFIFQYLLNVNRKFFHIGSFPFHFHYTFSVFLKKYIFYCFSVTTVDNAKLAMKMDVSNYECSRSCLNLEANSRIQSFTRSSATTDRSWRPPTFPE
jgi:WD40 repeat protein